MYDPLAICDGCNSRDCEELMGMYFCWNCRNYFDYGGNILAKEGGEKMADLKKCDVCKKDVQIEDCSKITTKNLGTKLTKIADVCNVCGSSDNTSLKVILAAVSWKKWSNETRSYQSAN